MRSKKAGSKSINIQDVIGKILNEINIASSSVDIEGKAFYTS